MKESSSWDTDQWNEVPRLIAEGVDPQRIALQCKVSLAMVLMMKDEYLTRQKQQRQQRPSRSAKQKEQSAHERQTQREGQKQLTQQAEQEQESQHVKMADRVQSGDDPQTVASRYGVSIHEVYAACRKHRVSYECRQNETKLTHPERQARRAEMATLVKDGIGPREVALRYKVTLRSVQIACQEHGVDFTKALLEARLVELIVQGEPPEAIIERYGVTKNRLTRLRKKHGIPYVCRQNEIKLTHPERQARRAEMATLVKDGISPREVASRYNVTLQLVEMACKEHGVEFKNPSLDARLVKALAQGESPEAIIEKYGVTKNRLTRLRKKHRLPSPRQTKAPRATNYRIISDLVHGRGKITEIAQRYRLTHQRICQYRDACIEHDIPIHERYTPCRRKSPETETERKARK